jgi:hypothetical protein
VFALFGFLVVSALVALGLLYVYNVAISLKRTIEMQRKELKWYRTAALRGDVAPYPGNIAD